nr:phosphate/phosphite/phosphonate ABC transporter substrate-binding protein [Anaerolineales bacterium]
MLKALRPLATVLVIALFLGGCGQSPEYKKVSLAEPGEQAVPTVVKGSKLPLRVAVAAVISPKGTVESYANLIAYLGERTGRPAELVQRGTYTEINDLVRTGGVDLAFVCTGGYIRGQQEFGMELLVAPQVDGETVYYSYIIVPADSQAQSLTDLRGKVFAFTDPMSNTGRLALLYMLWQMGETPESFLKRTLFTYSHDNSIKAVADRLVDGAAVDSLVYDYMVAQEPQYGAKTRIIHRSPPYGIPPVVVHPALDPQLKAQFRELFLRLHQDERGREILQKLMIDRFVIVDDQAYDSVREMMIQVR